MNVGAPLPASVSTLKVHLPLISAAYETRDNRQRPIIVRMQVNMLTYSSIAIGRTDSACAADLPSGGVYQNLRIKLGWIDWLDRLVGEERGPNKKNGVAR